MEIHKVINLYSKYFEKFIFLRRRDMLENLNKGKAAKRKEWRIFKYEHIQNEIFSDFNFLDELHHNGIALIEQSDDAPGGVKVINFIRLKNRQWDEEEALLLTCLIEFMMKSDTWVNWNKFKLVRGCSLSTIQFSNWIYFLENSFEWRCIHWFRSTH